MAMSINQNVVREIRAEMGRQQMTISSLAEQLGINERWLSKRLNGRMPLTLDEIELIAAVLGIPVLQLVQLRTDVA